ncbi:MAG TPA: tetratricopeptide repeat protein [Polyangia bacterium]|jgi:predicted TPR repeat methyltransferase|nr:tetratricopeptide repeat protein [Polyangia bacterium]
MTTPSKEAPVRRTVPAEMTIPDAVELAVGLQKGGLLDAAEEIYRRILAGVPDHADSLHFLGLSRHERGLHEEAIALVQRAVAAAPEHADAHNNLGNMYLEQGRVDEAEAQYRRVLALRPEHPGAHTNLGSVLRRKDDKAGAEVSFRRAIELDDEHAEAYHNLGSILRDTGRSHEALTAYQRALTLRPYDGESYRRVGATLYAVGRVDEAVGVYKSWLNLEPDNAVAKHMLASCSGDEVPARASDDFVRTTFDSFAASFDHVLGRLQYRAPALVGDAVAAALATASATLDVLDAGAGTGLCAPFLRPYARRLVGIDLSKEMLFRAKTRGGYDALETAELTAYMRAHPAAFDLVVSADTLCYFGDLSEAASSAAAALRPGGHLVFTVEHLAPESAVGFQINPHGRYSHGEDYVRRTLTAAGLGALSIQRAHLRIENMLPVEGLLVTARR